MKKFLNLYNLFLNKYSIINEGNVKSLIPLFQHSLIGDKKYNDLTDEQKADLQTNINQLCQQTEQKVNSITSNAQYKSWIYDILKNQDKDINEDYEVIKDAITDFEKICKRPDLDSKQKNIQNYKTFQDLQQFVLDFQNSHKQNTNIYDCFELIVKDSKYSVYQIKENQYDDCERIFGGHDLFNTGWCVAKNKQYFDRYISNSEDDRTKSYFVWIGSDNKPFALMHFGSAQFKYTNDDCVEDFDDPELVKTLVKKLNFDKQFWLNNIIKSYGSDFITCFGVVFNCSLFNITPEELFCQNHQTTCKMDDNGGVIIHVNPENYITDIRDKITKDLFFNIKISNVIFDSGDYLTAIDTFYRPDFADFIDALIQTYYKDNENRYNIMFHIIYSSLCDLNKNNHIEFNKNVGEIDSVSYNPFYSFFDEDRRVLKIDIDKIDDSVHFIHSYESTAIIFNTYYKNTISIQQLFCRIFTNSFINKNNNIVCKDQIKYIPRIFFDGSNVFSKFYYDPDYSKLLIHFDQYDFPEKLTDGKFAFDVKNHTIDGAKKGINKVACETWPNDFIYDEKTDSVDIKPVEYGCLTIPKELFDTEKGELLIRIKSSTTANITVNHTIGECLKSFKGFPAECNKLILGSKNIFLTTTEGIPKCKQLELFAPKITDFSHISPSVEKLNLHGCKGLKNLSQISHINYQLLDISSTGITSFEGLKPSIIYLIATFCKITSLKGIPNTCKRVTVDKCSQLTSLQGCPSDCEFLNCSRTAITNLVGISKKITNLFIDGCKNLTSMAGLTKPIEFVSCKAGTPLQHNKEFLSWRRKK